MYLFFKHCCLWLISVSSISSPLVGILSCNWNKPSSGLVCGSAKGSREATCSSKSLLADWARITQHRPQPHHLYSHLPLFPLAQLSPSCIEGCLPQPCHSHQSNSSWAGLAVTPLCQASSVSATAATTAAKLVRQKEDDSGDLMIHQGDREGRQRISNITAESLASISYGAFH